MKLPGPATGIVSLLRSSEDEQKRTSLATEECNTSGCGEQRKAMPCSAQSLDSTQTVVCSVTVQALQKAADAELMCVWGWRVFMSTINKCMKPYKSSHIKVS